MWDRSDEESSGDEDGIHANLGAQLFNWGAVESLGAVAIQSTHASSLAYGNGSLSDGEDTGKEGFSGL